MPSESDIKSFPAAYTEYLLSGEIIGELNCLTDERMQYSATCKTVVEVGKQYFCLAVVALSMLGTKLQVLLVLRGQWQSVNVYTLYILPWKNGFQVSLPQ